MCRNEYGKFFRRSHDALSCVYDGAGKVVETPSTRASSKSRERMEQKAAMRRSVTAD
jgi:hypothetical protein